MGSFAAEAAFFRPWRITSPGFEQTYTPGEPTSSAVLPLPCPLREPLPGRRRRRQPRAHGRLIGVEADLDGVGLALHALQARAPVIEAPVQALERAVLAAGPGARGRRD